MISRAGEHQAIVQIRFEDLELRGRPDKSEKSDESKKTEAISFRGKRLEVVDVDASGAKPVWLKPVDLGDANIAMQHGLEPAESDPQFHQQMVYAVAMRTLEQFDRALGRIVYFGGRRRLRLVPHAFQGSNAFFHPTFRAVLFGYFRASKDAPGENLPGQTIFTCLSHDIIAHEVTHAVVDRLRPYFSVATNPHVRAFHEGFADIVAVFQRLTFRELVQKALQDSKGDLRQARLLSNIAAQFGQGLGTGKALRTAIDNKTKVQDVHEEHDLGAVLVAAIYEGFYTTYERRTADLVRLATDGTGVLREGALHPDLVARLTSECVKTAQSVLTMCIRAFDYLPPADVTFGAFLRALVTADWELNPLDEIGLRAAIIEACRRRGIFAAEAGSLAVSALLLDSASRVEWEGHAETFRDWVDTSIHISVLEQRATPQDDVEIFSSSDLNESLLEQARAVRSSIPDAIDESNELPRAVQLRKQIFAWFSALTAEDRQRIGMRDESVLNRVHFHSSQRVTSDGTLRYGLVVQLIELQQVEVKGVMRDIPCGATLVIDVSGRVRFVIATSRPESRQKTLEHAAGLAMTDPMGWPLETASMNPLAVNYQGMHEGRI